MKSRLLVAAITAALTLSACGSDSNTASSSSSSAATSASSAGSPASNSAEAPSSASDGAAASFECATGELRTSGSTAQAKAMEEWILGFNAKCNANVGAYQGGGSGKGISDFTGNQVDFAGSDSSLKEDQAAAAKTLDEANTLYQQAEALLAEDFPTAPLWYSKTTSVWSDRVTDVKVNAFGVLDFAAIKVK